VIAKLGWEAREVFWAVKSLEGAPDAGITSNRLTLTLHRAVVAKGIPELEAAGLIARNEHGELALTEKGYNTRLDQN
jgi:hypothetical protein